MRQPPRGGGCLKNCKFAQKNGEGSWSILTPTLRKAGSEIWVTWNPELDTDPTWIRLVEKPFPDTLDIEMNWRDNPWFNDVLEKERLHAQATMSKIDYENIWDGKSRPAISGAIYADEIASMYQQGRIGKHPYDPRLLVYPVFDRGFTDKMAIGCRQRRGNTLTCVHYIEDDKKTYPYYAADLKKLGFNFGTVFIPHDANHGNPQTGQTDAQKMQDLGWTVQVLPKRLEPRSAPCQRRDCTSRAPAAQARQSC